MSISSTLAKIVAWLKKIVVPIKWRKYVWIAAAGLVLIIAVKWLSLRPVQDDELAAKVSLSEAKKFSREQEKKHAALIAKYQKTIQEKDYLLDRKDADIERKEGEIAKVDITLAELQDKYKLLTDCPSMLVNMTEQKDQWIGKFNLCEGKVQDLTDKVTLWTGKYAAAFQMGELYRQNWNNSKEVVKSQEDLLAALKKDIAKRKITGALKSGLVLAAAGYIIYAAVKK
jgi:hypothetical protein